MIKLVIFDLDGTLLNSLGDLTNACNYVLSKHGFPLHKPEEYRYFIGSGIRNLIRLALPESVRNDDAFCYQILDEFFYRYNTHLNEETCAYEGVISLLHTLSSRGIQLAIASNKYQEGVNAVTDYYFKDIKFAIRLGTSNEIPNKPNPLIVKKILEACPFKREEVLYVGDSGIDMQTAKNYGLTAVAVLWGFRRKEELIDSGANYLLTHPAELLALI